ncbi:pyridoxal-phosphate dependent enzyme [Nocardiopsis baichengensis]|uniref:pyridoxal-phosphate dependent enzyme n=1 Tax=Nocardiopsis baichengensis TaxID=280240 RepID=UPI00034786CC|nr:pyridoxal-phosphate dependent enzyme [Nocardiopsis baichengensis]
MSPLTDGARLLAAATGVPDYTPTVTPIEEHAGVLVKREDAWTRSGASGAKARALFTAAENAQGVVSAGARISPQLERAALVAHALGIPARLHTGYGKPTNETQLAEAAGATVFRHHPGRLTVIRARYRADAHTYKEAGWACVPFGMEHPVYLAQVSEQATRLPREVGRVVVPVGSGMTLAAIIRGLEASGHTATVLGVRVGADPTRLLDWYAPGWTERTTLVDAIDFYDEAADNHLGDLALDPHYEAKCLPFVGDGDLLWAVGARTSTLI